MERKRLTVKELKEELDCYPDNAEVYFNANGEYFSVTEIRFEEVLKDDDVMIV